MCLFCAALTQTFNARFINVPLQPGILFFWEGTEKDKKAIISLPPHSFSGTLFLSLSLFSQADDKWRERSRAAGADGVCDDGGGGG